MNLAITELTKRLRGLTREQLLALEPAERENIAQTLLDFRYEGVDKHCAEDPLWWAQNLTMTENPHWEKQGVPFKSAFPKKSYFVPLFEAFRKHRLLCIPKTREMLTSWAAMVYATHHAQWHKAEVVIQTSKEEKAHRLVEYATILYRNQAEWLKRKHPLKSEPTALKLEWVDGGRLHGIPSGEDQIRMFHPTLVIFDEAAFLPGFHACWMAAYPVAQQMIAISSAAPGPFGDWCSR